MSPRRVLYWDLVGGAAGALAGTMMLQMAVAAGRAEPADLGAQQRAEQQSDLVKKFLHKAWNPQDRREWSRS